MIGISLNLDAEVVTAWGYGVVARKSARRTVRREYGRETKEG